MLWRLLHRCRISEYLHDDNTWAVVTGSTDGIGKCLADEILRHGFNVLVHGRSPSKLANVVAWLRARHPARQVDSVIADLAQLGDIPNILNAIKSKNVSIFINNAASTDRDMSLFADLPMEQIDHVMTTGVLFTTKLIHGTLPYLSKTRSIMINVGSQSGEVAAPYVSIYASSKTYLLTLTKCLARESRLARSSTDFLYLDIHMVHTPSNSFPVNFVTPTTEAAASSIVNCIGCGYDTVTPYWTHEIMGYFAPVLPRFLMELALKASMEDVKRMMESKTQTGGPAASGSSTAHHHKSE